MFYKDVSFSVDKKRTIKWTKAWTEKFAKTD